MAKVALQDAQLVITPSGIGQQQPVALKLDALRLVYLFLPSKFRWHLLAPSETSLQYLNLESLSESDLVQLGQTLAQQPGALQKEFTFFIKDYAGQGACVTLAEATAAGVDLIAELGPGRATRTERRQAWLRDKPTVTTVGLTFNMQQVQKGNKAVAWPALDHIELKEVRSFGTTYYVHFMPVKKSGSRHFAQGFRPREMEAVLAEIDFWRKMAGSATA